MTTETAAPAAAVTTPDEFDKAFGEAITAIDTETAAEAKPAAATEAAPAAAATTTVPAVAPATTEGGTTTTPVPATTEGGTATSEAPAAPATGTEAAPAAAAAAAPAADARQLADEAARRVADEKTQRETQEKADRDAAEAREIKDPVLSAEDAAQFESFRKEWPDVAKAVEKMSAHATAQLEAKFARSLVAIVEKVYGDIAPLAQSVSSVEGTSFRSSVLEKHSDYDTVFPKLEGWIAAQPPYLAQAYKRVYDEGNVQEVVDLVSRYKTSSGVQPQSPTTVPAPAASTPAAPAAPAASPATQAAAAALAPVTSKRSTPTKQGEDPNDFDGAFASAVADMK
jgi:hypothetical protein